MTTNVTDILCLLSFFGMLQLYLLFPIVIARGCQWLPWDIFMARDLRWPRYGYMFNLSMACLIIGFLLQSCVYLFIPMALSQQTTMSDWAIVLTLQTLNVTYFVVLVSSNIFVIIWIEKLGDICRENNDLNTIISFIDPGQGPIEAVSRKSELYQLDPKQETFLKHCKKCIIYHQTMDKAFGFIFLCMFSFCQVFIITNLFNIISFQMMDSQQVWQRHIHSTSFFFLSVHLILIILCVTCTAENSYNELKDLANQMKTRGTGYTNYFILRSLN